MKNILFLLIIGMVTIACKEQTKESQQESETVDISEESENTTEEFLKIHPVLHASMVLQWEDTTIYVDPTGELTQYSDLADPDLILITDIHGDHLSLNTLKALNTSLSKIVVPQAVADELPSEYAAQVDVINNGEVKDFLGLTIEAIPMYNLRDEAKAFHPKGRGNGYIIERDGKRVYISGDTEDIPEMRSLEKIDLAFVCMNLPYTMTELKAAEAVLDFKPKQVYPYHYRGAAGFSNVAMFENFIKNRDTLKNIEVVRLDWYPASE